MISTVLFLPSWSVLYCSVHQRTWVEEGNHWMTYGEPPLDMREVTEVACNACMGDVLTTFREQFPGLYASASTPDKPRPDLHHERSCLIPTPADGLE